LSKQNNNPNDSKRRTKDSRLGGSISVKDLRELNKSKESNTLASIHKIIQKQQSVADK
jgi:hypothetical protein